MSEQRLETSAAAGVTSDADPGEGQGLAHASAHQGGGADEAGDLAVPGDERTTADEVPEGGTEGERSINAALEAQQANTPPGNGLDPDDIPDEGPDAGHRYGPGDDERPSRADLDASARGSGSIDVTNRGRGGSVTQNDVSHPLG